MSECEICNRVITSKQSLLRHEARFHPEDETSDSTEVQSEGKGQQEVSDDDGTNEVETITAIILEATKDMDDVQTSEDILEKYSQVHKRFRQLVRGFSLNVKVWC